MPQHELSNLTPEAFENLTNYLALRTLGAGITGFGPGSDGGRDGYFEGEAPYPSLTDRWRGVWYIQSKFHSVQGSKTGQKWLIDQVRDEIKAFDDERSDRVWPDIWIIATNIDQSGKPETGSFDAIRKLVSESRGGKNTKVAVWGGRKILDLLGEHEDVARYYGHFLTPGHLISKLYEELELLSEKRTSLQELVRYFIVTQFTEHMYTKLEQAGSSSDIRPAVHDLFIDLPFKSVFKGKDSFEDGDNKNLLLANLCQAAAQNHRCSLRKTIPENWKSWTRVAKRARVTLIKGGPGQGKSTVGQYMCQIQRAHLILSNEINVAEQVKNTARLLKNVAETGGFWPSTARIPIQIELKEYAHWHSLRSDDQARNVLSYLSWIIARKLGSEMSVKTLRKALSRQAWLVVFDGLDEVPNDHKDEISREVTYFVNDVLIDIDSDALVLCTSRPQGYSGQFSALDGAEVALTRLDRSTALQCACPVLKFNRGIDEATKSIQVLEAALNSQNIRELMTTPLQSHIMAVVVRDGGKPPERRWRLFQSFYQVMKRRESLKDFKNPKIAELLQGEDRLLKAVHMRLGFVLHARAEKSSGAQTVLSRNEFKDLVRYVVEDLGSENVEETVNVVMEATTERLVLVSTPDNGDQVRFDIRQLQEFFAAEFLYDGVSPDELATRINVLGADAHWREVMHFLLSALVADRRTTELAIAVQELQRINEGDAEGKSYLYRRRSAPATQMAIRLLLEGILEDDQKDRRNMKPLVSAIGGMSELEQLARLADLSQRNSRQWLLNVLRERMETSSPLEGMGCIYLLGLMLSDDAAEGEAVKEAFLNLPKNLTEILIDKWSKIFTGAYRRFRQKHDLSAYISLWVITAIVGILNSNEWNLYSDKTIDKMLSILSESQNKLDSAFEKNGLSDAVKEAVITCLFKMRISYRQDKKSKGMSFSCGPIGVTRYEHDWTTGTLPDELKTLCFKPLLGQVAGFFKLSLLCAAFGQERTAASLFDFVSFSENISPAHIAVLPSALRAFVPIENETAVEPSSAMHLKSIRLEDNIIEYLQKIEVEILPPFGEYRLISNIKGSARTWIGLTKKMPAFAIRILFEPENSPLHLEKIEIVPELLSLITNKPEQLAPHILRWGVLQNVNPAVLRILKSNVRKLPDRPSPFGDPFGISVKPFPILLPNDAHLLPILAEAIVQAFGINMEHRLERVLNAEKFDLIRGFGLSSVETRAIAIDRSQSKYIRAGALALYWIISNEDLVPGADGSYDLTIEQELYEEIVTDATQVWLTTVLISAILMRTNELNDSALSFVELLLRKDVEGVLHSTVNVLLEIWGERSSSPVTTRNHLSRWLGYSDRIPSYAK